MSSVLLVFCGLLSKVVTFIYLTLSGLKIFQKSLLCLTALTLTSCSASKDTLASESEAEKALIKDIDYVCSIVREKYIYFDDKISDWDKACKLANSEANSFPAEPYPLVVLERLLEELYDPHVSLGVNSQASPMLVPSGADISVRMDGDRVFVSHLRPESSASRVLKINDEIIEINGLPIIAAAKARMRTGDKTNSDRLRWAVMAELAGYRNEERHLIVDRENKRLTFRLKPHNALVRPVLSSVGQMSDSTAFIRINNSLGSSGLMEEITSFLAQADFENGLILDLRDTPSGGNTSVAEPILGLFISSDEVYQITEYADGKQYRAFPKRSQTYYPNIPMAVLVGPWTGSMGEGMAIGFDGTNRAPIFGSRMAGLAGGTETFNLPGSGYSFSIPTYNLLHVNGTERSNYTGISATDENINTKIRSEALKTSLVGYLSND